MYDLQKAINKGKINLCNLENIDFTRFNILNVIIIYFFKMSLIIIFYFLFFNI